ncbi:MAG TPA: GNAT family N-acetyltransferase [bacterium]|nr:GNAT family N-acetyltransferase [bacterium]
MERGIQITFEKYTGEDFPEFRDMVFALYTEDAVGEKITVRKIKKTISALADRPGTEDIFLFRNFAEPIGYAILIDYWSNEYGGPIVFIDEFYVKPPSRGQGVGSRFLEFFIRSHRNRVKALQLEVSGGNKKAIGFYRRNGFRSNENLSMIRKI